MNKKKHRFSNLQLFRHGSRTPELKDVFPNDPHKEEDFMPMGWGQLTNVSKNTFACLLISLTNFNRVILDNSIIQKNPSAVAY